MKKILIILVLCSFINESFAVDYSQFDVNDINAVNKAVKAYQEEFKDKKGSKEAENGYREFRKFYFDFFQAQSPKIEKECAEKYSSMTFHRLNKKSVPYLISLPRIANEFGKKYEKYGLTIRFDEEFFYPEISFKYLYDNFSLYLSPEDKILMKFEMEHFDKTWISDNHFVVTKEEIEETLRFYKRFKAKYPEYSRNINIDETINTFQKELKCFPNAYPCLYR